MRKRSGSQHSGFGILEALLVIAVIGAIVGVSVVVYQHNRTKATSAAANSTTPTNSQTTNSAIVYLTIKEWHIKFPLSDTIKDAYYVPGVGSIGSDGVTNQVYLGLTSLDADGCTADGSNHGKDSAIATIFRSKPGEVDPVTNKPITQEYPNGVSIGNYSYAMVGQANTNISTCKAPQNSIESADSAFGSAAKSLASAN